MTGNYSPYNREFLWASDYDTTSPIYNLTATLNRIRNHAISVDSRYAFNHSQQLFLDDATMCTRKGPDGVQIVACFSNQGSQSGVYNLTVPGGFNTGDEVIELLSCSRSYAWGSGNITAEMGQGLPKVFFPVNNMNGTGLCGYSLNESSVSVPPSSKATATGTKTDTAATATSTKHQVDGADSMNVTIGAVMLGLLFAAGVWFL